MVHIEPSPAVWRLLHLRLLPGDPAANNATVTLSAPDPEKKAARHNTAAL